MTKAQLINELIDEGDIAHTLSHLLKVYEKLDPDEFAYDSCVDEGLAILKELEDGKECGFQTGLECTNPREICHNPVEKENDICEDCRRFSAILSKNYIARELTSSEPSMRTIEYELRQIEEYLGTANQPSVEDILNYGDNV